MDKTASKRANAGYAWRLEGSHLYEIGVSYNQYTFFRPPRLTFLRPDPAESARSPLSLSRRFNEVVDLEEVSR